MLKTTKDLNLLYILVSLSLLLIYIVLVLIANIFLHEILVIMIKNIDIKFFKISFF